jgi:hypothetical protein
MPSTYKTTIFGKRLHLKAKIFLKTEKFDSLYHFVREMSNDFVWKAAGCGGIRRFLFLNCELRRDVAPAFQSHPSALPTISISDFSFQKNRRDS